MNKKFMENKVIKKINTREFPLALCEIWGRGYKYFLKRETKTFPRFIFRMKNGIVEAFRNEDMADELCDLLFEKYKRDKKYISKFNKEFLNRFKELEELWHRDYLDKKELFRFAAKMQDFWPAIFTSIYLPLSKNNFTESDRHLMMDLREKIDVAADNATHIILKSLEKLNPNSGTQNYYVILNDLKGSKINIKKIKDRTRKKIYMVDDKIISEDKMKYFERQYNFRLEKNKVLRASQFTGSIAFEGFVRGKVRIILKRKEIDSFGRGEILVSAMTVPDFLPAMRKAAAFITDEGGLTCHAAILARELKKPCIIGTKIATKVLHDGDLVEVDAERGIVRIIKKTK